MENQPPSPQPTEQPPQLPSATNGLAVAGLVVGIVAFFSGWVPVFGLAVGITAVILSILGIRKGGQQKGMAIAGLVTGGLGLLWGLVISTFFILGIVSGINSYNNSQRPTSPDSSYRSTTLGNDEMGGYSFKVNEVTRDYKPQNTVADDTTEYIVVNLTIKNVSNDSNMFATYPLALMADEKSSPVSYVEVDPTLVSAAIPKGETVTGNLVFQIARDAEDLMLDYTETVTNRNGESTTKTDSIRVE